MSKPVWTGLGIGAFVWWIWATWQAWANYYNDTPRLVYLGLSLTFAVLCGACFKRGTIPSAKPDGSEAGPKH